jgi:GT2 family glycosyltransferase
MINHGSQPRRSLLARVAGTVAAGAHKPSAGFDRNYRPNYWLVKSLSYRRMKIGLIIASYGRPEMVRQLLSTIERQARLPDEIVLSVVTEKDCPAAAPDNLKVDVVYASPGLCAQRNKGLGALQDRVDVVLFIDDDFWMSENYVAELERIFSANEDVVAVTGLVLADGATTPGISIAEANKYLEDHVPASTPSIRDVPATYGCNMAFRASKISDLKFDERLPLYGWQEDVDFSAQLRRRGRVVATNRLWGVHLGTKKGKISGVRFGYSQVINPLFIVKKGNMSRRRALRLICKNIAANVVKSVFPERYVDRWGRLKGNLIGLLHAATGKLDPMYALKL